MSYRVVLEGINMKVYYLKAKYAELMMSTERITLKNMNETHVNMPVLFPITIKTPDEAFAILNGGGCIANPLDTLKSQQFIRENGTHTSMSVGDIIEIKGVYYLCEDAGWKIYKDEK